MSGITCEQELLEHLDLITLENELGTHVELTIPSKCISDQFHEC